MTITDKHILFWGDWPSNFAWSPMKTKCLDGQIHEFFSSEQCYMWHKAYYFKDFPTLNEIEDLNFKEASSYKAKKLGRMVQNFDQDEWNKVSYDIMLNACLSKYSHCRDKPQMRVKNRRQRDKPQQGGHLSPLLIPLQ